MRHFIALSDRIFAVDTMAASALPREIRLSSSSWADYLKAFRLHLAIGFESGIQRFGPTRSDVVGVRQRDNLRVVILRSESNEHTRTSAWFLCPAPEMRVCDVEVDGIRMSTHHRREFSAVLARDGLTMLIEHLRAGRLVRP